MKDPRDNGVALLAAALTLIVGTLLLVMWHEDASALTLPPSYSFFDSQWGGIDVDGTNGCATFGCSNVVTLGYISGHVLTYEPHEISLVTSYDYATGAVVGTTVCIYGVGPGCATNLDSFAASSSDGTYFGISGVSTSGGGAPAYVIFTVTGGLVTSVGNLPFPGSSTLVVEMSPADQTITATSSVPISIGYFLQSSEAELTQVNITLLDISTGYSVVFNGQIGTTTTNTVATSTQTFQLISGHTYTYTASLTDAAGDAQRSADSNTIGAGPNGSAEFSVVQNNLLETLGASSTSALYTLGTSTCSIANITGCFQNAISWAFAPSPAMLQLIAQQGSQISARPPVGYLFSTITAVQQLEASGTPAFTLAEDEPIMQYIFQPIAGGLVGIVWLAAAIWFIKRLQHIVL